MNSINIEESRNDQAEKILFNFRRAFLIYINSPNDTNQNKLYQSGLELSKLAVENTHNSSDYTLIAKELAQLTKRSLVNICVCTTKINRLNCFFEDNPDPSNALVAAYNILRNRLITNEQDEFFSSIYAIELDGYRLRNIDPEASAACFALSDNLLAKSQISQKKS
ncbi:MAG: hypothetical protein QM652_11560 [Legionella sp.]|uniref:hypothetical protein n=1 Tax=Legionella sp. TaxID=459 RepID=UPI0039E23C3E